MASAAGLESRLGHTFRDRRLLEQALTHSSYVNEHPHPPLIANERLEFLGDAVLSLVISEALWDRHPDDAEGVLTTRRAAIVSARDLARIATRIDLGAYLRLGQGAERSGERTRGSVLASTLEAVVAAVYLDGGLEAARRLVIGLCGPELDQPTAPVTLKPPKSRLQELAYRRVGRPPSYRVLSIEGPAHERRYQVDVVLAGAVLGTGAGRSRRDAETEAATMALASLAAAASGADPADDADDLAGLDAGPGDCASGGTPSRDGVPGGAPSTAAAEGAADRDGAAHRDGAAPAEGAADRDGARAAGGLTAGAKAPGATSSGER